MLNIEAGRRGFERPFNNVTSNRAGVIFDRLRDGINTVLEMAKTGSKKWSGEKGDERRKREKPLTKRQKLIEKNSGGKKKKNKNIEDDLVSIDEE